MARLERNPKEPERRIVRRTRLVMLRYALTILTSAFLLFQVQPLIAKCILPWFGGGPAVWTTCMLFFQVLLLGGYAYAHGVSTYLRPRRQIVLHTLLLAGALVLLPIQPSEALKPTGADSPIQSILWLLLLTVGGPYFVLSSTGPLLQRWFARSYPGRSPYRLYALSNLGSLFALLSYPFFFEPQFAVDQQIWGWSIGFAVYAALLTWCSVRFWGVGASDGHAIAARAADDPDAAPGKTTASAPTLGRMAMWVGLSAAGSALLLSTTNQMCLDVAVVPFLWVVPLSLYLLTFVICFDNERWYDPRVFGVLTVLSVPAVCWLLDQELDADIASQITIYTLVMFAFCMTCHGELARSRPPPRHLTLFFLLVSIGGALGGIFVAVVAPVVFVDFWEYHITLIAASALIVISWCVNRAWDGEYTAVFWVWFLISVGLLFAAVRFLYLPHAETLEPVEVVTLLGGLLALHAVGWFVSAQREDMPLMLTTMWTGITLAGLYWGHRFMAATFEEGIGTITLANMFLSSGLVLLAGILLAWLAAAKTTLSFRRAALVLVLQLTTLATLAGVYDSSLVQPGAVLAATLVYVGMVALATCWLRFSGSRILASGCWFWAPASSALVLLCAGIHGLTRTTEEGVVHISRNFYGVLKVTLSTDDNGELYRLTHGRIEHGIQYTDEVMRMSPTTYYGPDTGIGLAMGLHPGRAEDAPGGGTLDVGIVGLGAGSIAAYGRPGDRYRFYEINPDVVTLANRYFTYLSDSKASTEVILGDARITLARELETSGSQQFDVLAIDAFSSDAIPAHLLTAECAEIYRQHLKDDGVLMVHISNRYLDLNPICRGLAQRLDWTAMRVETDDVDEEGVYGATWIVITANKTILARLEEFDLHAPFDDEDLEPILWTDNTANLWQVFSS